MKLHKGKMERCKICFPNYKPRREREVRKELRVVDLHGDVRRQVGIEIGEDEVSKEQRFALLQKYGVNAAKIDRKVNKPSWMDKRTFNQKLNEWFRATKGLVPVIQERRKPLMGKPHHDRKRPFHPYNNRSHRSS